MRVSSALTGPNAADGSGYETIKQESEAETDRTSPCFSLRPGFTAKSALFGPFFNAREGREETCRMRGDESKRACYSGGGNREKEDVKHREKRLSERSLTGKNDGHRGTC